MSSVEGSIQCVPGNSGRDVQEQLKDARKVQANQKAFAAILTDGSVVTWGEGKSGGDSSAVRDQLKGVQHIQASFRAFAAILADGSVVTWGNAAVTASPCSTS